ncbi:metalloregulator ArsR/SmtB family transcription factor [Halanaerobium sp. Z-7514]|uniref:Metalloregulator ArsR/SmtB family transcription factor n=1 Tax=Halanaerobium polyolivorans TaxID=2886943 RepID=A0AAW4X052_9FIRM|nr:metalloregulator ArsR/SmtB family transcription factor [Halanaerobium polyolivorans]MCC3144991.1 metalloregulator ArsR/SmtB family transcription factor [Halanaerobium polyolivorans]
MTFFTSDKSSKIIEKNSAVLEEEAELLKALAHPVRLTIVKGLLAEEGCNVSEMQQCLDIPQSTLSQHLAKLRDAGILKSERNGLERHYFVVNDKAKKIIKVLAELKYSKEK